MRQPDCIHTIAPRPSSVLAVLVALAWFGVRRLGDGCRRTAELGLSWLERSRQRRALGQLSDHMLRDIGVSRADAWAEADKPFWRP